MRGRSVRYPQDFEVELRKIDVRRRNRLGWKIEPHIFVHIRAAAVRQGRPIRADGTILGLPFEIGTTRSGTFELVAQYSEDPDPYSSRPGRRLRMLQRSTRLRATRRRQV